jgi:peptide/nickel transport system substrate-binding protein
MRGRSSISVTKRAAGLLGVTSMLAVTLAACGSSGKSSSGSDSGGSKSGGGTLIIGMTAASLPGTDAGTFESEGWEGERFVGLQLYDGLTRYKLDDGTKATVAEPDLATSWSVGADKLTWTFKLRTGVKFHDGTPWNADAAVFGLDRLLNKTSPNFSADNAGNLSYVTGTIKSYAKVDDSTITITTSAPNPFLPLDLPTVVFPSPTAVKAEGKAYADKPVGTGPFKFASKVAGQSLTMVPNADYWNGAPKLEKLILRPIPSPTDRSAALLSGEINWAEFPSPDDLTALKDKGFQVEENPYSHIWPWIFDTTKGPLKDAKVRQALNYAIDRESLSKDILQGTGVPAEQYIPAADQAYDAKNNLLTYDVDKAKKLLAEAGYADGFDMTVVYPTGGSGNMVPQPMDEFLQSNLAKIGVKVKLVPLDWSTVLGDWIAGKISNGANAVVVSQGFMPPDGYGMLFGSKSALNVGHLDDPKVDDLITNLYNSFTVPEQTKAFQALNAQLVTDSPWLVVVSDNNPRVLAANVKGFVQPRAVWVDLTQVTVTGK